MLNLKRYRGKTVAAHRRLMYRSRAIAVALAAVVGLAGCGSPISFDRHEARLTQSQLEGVAAMRSQVGDLSVVAVDIVTTNDDHFIVGALLADDATSRRRGLMGVGDVAEGTGMLFVFDEPTTDGFWMYDTPIELDVAFISADRVIAVATMRPCADQPCPITAPPQPYDAALEVPGGWLNQVGIAAGDSITW